MIPARLETRLCEVLHKQFRIPPQSAPLTMQRKLSPPSPMPPAAPFLSKKTNRPDRIVPDRSIFVNSYANHKILGLVIPFLIASLLSSSDNLGNRLCAQSPTPPSAFPPDEESTAYLQAKEKLGASSRIVWGEAGPTSLDRWQARSSVEFEGVIVAWETDQLTLVKKNGTGTTTLPGDLLVGITPGWKSPAFERTHQLWLNKDFPAVISSGQKALAEREIPRWQQRLLVTEMIESAVAINQLAVACRIFQALGDDPIPELLLSRIPLPWSTELDHVPPALASEASVWMNHDTPSLRLLGASWSLTGPNRLEAVEKLKELGKLREQTKPTHRLIATYALVQLWRTAPEDTILSSELDHWIQLRDSLPIPMQAGPTVLLATRLEQANQFELALAEWLRILALHADRPAMAKLAQTRSTTLAKQIATLNAQGQPRPNQ